MIEHNLETRIADWIINPALGLDPRVGPEGGDGGGEIVAVGRPEEIAREKRSYTGAFLKELLQRRPVRRRVEAAE